MPQKNTAAIDSRTCWFAAARAVLRAGGIGSALARHFTTGDFERGTAPARASSSVAPSPGRAGARCGSSSERDQQQQLRGPAERADRRDHVRSVSGRVIREGRHASRPEIIGKNVMCENERREKCHCPASSYMRPVRFGKVAMPANANSDRRPARNEMGHDVIGVVQADVDGTIASTRPVKPPS